MRRARRWTRCVLLAALPLLAGGMALAGDDTTELFVLLDPARADIDGDGLVSPGEAMTFKELLGILTPEDPVLAQIVIAYGYAMDKGAVSPVDLKFLFKTAVTGEEAEEFAVLALPPPCPCMAFTRGDANNSNTLDIGDMIYILNYVFQSGSAPVPLDSGDANDDGVIDVADAIYISSYLFSQVEPKPPLPFGPHGGPYFEGLDPTPDALNGSCDLRVANFAEFAPAVAHIDMTGDGNRDAVWVTPNGVISFEEAGTYEAMAFEHDFEDYATQVFSVAVGKNGVVYGITDKADGTFFAMEDTTGDGIADVLRACTLGANRKILDGVLVDVSLPGTSTEAQALVLLHQVNGKEAFSICKDSDSDGYIDTAGAVFVQGNMLDNVRGIAVDGRTARVFVSGTRLVSGVPVPAVVFYRDSLCNGVAPGGDKIIDGVAGVAYYDESPTAPDPDYEFPAIHYLPYEKTLYILAVKADYRTSLICVMDTNDDVWSWQQSCRSDLKQADPANPPKYLNVFAFDKEGTHYIEASVTMTDGWTVWEYLAAAGSGCSCWAGIEPAVFTVPDAGLAAMQIPVCYAYVIQMGGDYISNAMVFDRAVFDSLATMPETDGCNRHVTAYYGLGMSTEGFTGTCGAKPSSSHTHAEDSVGLDIGYAVYRWFNAPDANVWAQELWAESHTTWGFMTPSCTDSYPPLPGRSVLWHLDGDIVLDGTLFGFDVFEDFDGQLLPHEVNTRYREYGGSGGNAPPVWELDRPHGSWSATYTNHGGGIAPSVGPGSPFTVDVRLNVDATRTAGGAGDFEKGDVRLHNGQATDWALWCFFRIRCK